MKLITALTILLFAAHPAVAQKINIDYDPTYDRSRIKTFAWAKTEETSLAERNPLLHSRIVNALEHYLGEGGLREVEQEPDVFVTYHTNAETELQLSVVDWGYDYPDEWYWGGGYWGASSTTVRPYNRGTLVVDIWDRRTNELIWRGSAAGLVPQNEIKVELKIYKSLRKMARKWQKLKTQTDRGQ